MVRKSRGEDSSRIRNCSKCRDSTLMVTPFRSRTGNHPESSVTKHLFRIGVSMILFHRSELVVIVQRAFDNIVKFGQVFSSVRVGHDTTSYFLPKYD